MGLKVVVLLCAIGSVLARSGWIALRVVQNSMKFDLVFCPLCLGWGDRRYFVGVCCKRADAVVGRLTGGTRSSPGPIACPVHRGRLRYGGRRGVRAPEAAGCNST